jgi:hydroxymethylglutaryl-CoA synthase
MRGILRHGAYVPYRRLDRGEIKAFLGSGGGSGPRSVASYDEDTNTMGVEAARIALAGAPVAPTALWFSTTAPAYAEKTNATTVHAALRLDRDVAALDITGAARSGSGALRAALRGDGPTLVVAADIRTGLPGSADEAAGGDGAAALLIGTDADGPLLAAHLGGASTTAEFLDRWRGAGETRTKQWEEKFGEVEYVPLGEEAWNAALKDAALTPDAVTRVAVVGPHGRAVKGLARKLGVADDAFAPDLTKTVGQCGTAHPALALSAMLDQASVGDVVAVVALADGVDVEFFRVTADAASARPLDAQIANGGAVTYAKFLTWRGMLTVEPPRRPEPARVSASAAARADDWKYGFVGSRDRGSGAVHLPPARVSMVGGAIDDMEPMPMADALGTIVTFTVDRLAYSPSPPVVFAVVDFTGGGRLPIELTDVDEGDVVMGGQVEMTFRRLNTADGIHNYFWKARPVRG